MKPSSRSDHHVLFRKRIRRRLLYWLIGVFVVIVFALMTGSSDPLLRQFNASTSVGASGQPVDQSIYETARALATLAAVPQEQQLAVAALRASDHELDQSFASAIRQSTRRSGTSSPEELTATQAINRLRELAKKDQAQIDLLQGETASSPNQDNDERIRLAEAQLSLDNDELENAQEDLKRLGGDQHAQLQQAFDQHRAIENQASALPRNTATAELENAEALSSVRGRVAALLSLQDRQKRLDAALDQVGKALGLVQGQLKASLEDHKRLSSAPAGGESSENKRDRLSTLTEAEKTEEDLQRRTRDLTQARAVYSDWRTLVGNQQHSLKFALLANGMYALMSVLGALVIISVIQYAVSAAERRTHRRLDHIRLLATLIVELLVATRFFLVLFGIPENISTAVGLVTAAVTVALRDYVVSFVGWFALMGKKGIRSGDWVEIDGTQGEVAEITVLHTYLLETGNWTTHGHPTGRQAVFLNKYAVERKYLNFSTENQWLWDELTIPVPTGRTVDNDLLNQMTASVTAATAESTAKAGHAWYDFMSAHKLAELSETPAVVLRTSVAGFEIRARYVTSAKDRFQSAVQIRQAIVNMLL